MLFNLIQNAIRHTPADGSVVVRAESVAAGIEFEVADTGDGIAAEERERVFTAFYRGGTDSARTQPGRRPGAGRLARDRRGARRTDLAGRRRGGHACALQPARGDVVATYFGAALSPYCRWIAKVRSRDAGKVLREVESLA